MTALDDAAAVATDTRLISPLRAALERAAVDVMNEGGDTVGHDRRVAHASLVLQSPASWIEPWLWAVSTNTTLVTKWVAGDTEGATSDLPFVVSTLWDAMAGVHA